MKSLIEQDNQNGNNKKYSIKSFSFCVSRLLSIILKDVVLQIQLRKT